MKIKTTVFLCLVLAGFSAAPNAQALELTRRQRWLFRALGVGLVGVGFIARSNEEAANRRADAAMADFLASHQNSQVPGFRNDQFDAVAAQSAHQRNANAWSIGKNASWGMAGLLFTASLVPNSWLRPAESGQGATIGYDIHWGEGGLPRKRR